MGLFDGLKDTVHKGDAVIIVKNLLEMQAQAGLLDLDPTQLAYRLVGPLWDQKPDIFSGKFGQRPFKITVAAAALANGISLFEEHDMNRSALVISLGNILSELEVNGRLYPLNSLDHQLLENAAVVFAQAVGDATEAEPAAASRNSRLDRDKPKPKIDQWVAETERELTAGKPASASVRLVFHLVIAAVTFGLLVLIFGCSHAEWPNSWSGR